MKGISLRRVVAFFHSWWLNDWLVLGVNSHVLGRDGQVHELSSSVLPDKAVFSDLLCFNGIHRYSYWHFFPRGHDD